MFTLLFRNLIDELVINIKVKLKCKKMKHVEDSFFEQDIIHISPYSISSMFNDQVHFLRRLLRPFVKYNIKKTFELAMENVFTEDIIFCTVPARIITN